MRNFLCLLWLVWICSINVCLSIQWCVIIFLKTEQTPWETKTKQGNSNQMQFFKVTTTYIHLCTTIPCLLLSYHPRRLHCCFIRRDLASSKSSNSFSDEQQPTPRPAPCSCLLWLLSKKKIDGANITRRRRCWHLM